MARALAWSRLLGAAFFLGASICAVPASAYAAGEAAKPNSAAPQTVLPKTPPAPGIERESAADPYNLDALFDRLAKTDDEDEAKGIARLIERRWMRSGSDTADLLMSRAVAAYTTGNQPLAIELLDRIIALKPDWAEAWNRRASVFFALDDYDRAVADIRQTLALEPRHFSAWAGLGMIFRSLDDDKHALDAFRHALAINPFTEGVKSAVDRLTPGVDGRDL
jgi:tetratricopeptide (TPR) repeat protein